ncbi:adhesive domain-containing protein [Lactococcus taiwanensis]|uniref:adhesive domain-containing protein n=1 Tax=Lactococcus taiwanensis TaxID=1151742 RepID=UPI0028A9B3BB|nr:adhesive domain-containing protein [Lactococcus taiwanensis]
MKKIAKKQATITFTTFIIAGTAFGFPLLDATTLTAKAAEIGVTINQNTSLKTSLPTTITSPGVNSGSFVINNSTLAELQLGLASLKTAQVQIPKQLSGLLVPNGTATVNMTANWNLFNLQVLGIGDALKQLAEMGNTGVINLLNQWQNQGVSISLQDLLKNPILNQITGIKNILSQIRTTISNINILINNANTLTNAVGVNIPLLDLSTFSVKFGLNVSDVYQSLINLNQLENIGNKETSQNITLSNNDGVLNATFDDTSIKFVQDTLNGSLTNIQNAVNKFSLTVAVSFPGGNYSLQQQVLNAIPQNSLTQGIVDAVKKAIPAGSIQDWINNGVTTSGIDIDIPLTAGIHIPGLNIAGITPALNGLFVPVKTNITNVVSKIQTYVPQLTNLTILGDVSVLKSASIGFPVKMDTEKEWFETYAPNGFTGVFTGQIYTPTMLAGDLWKNTGNNTQKIYFKDIVPPIAPKLAQVSALSMLVKAENSSRIVIKNTGGAVVGQGDIGGKLPDNAQGPLPTSSIKINMTGVKPGDKLNVVSIDNHGNQSSPSTAVAKAPLEVSPPTDSGESGNASSNHPSTSKPGTVKPVKTQVVYRLYNPNTGEHFYPTSIYERDMDLKAGWRNEGTLETAPTSGKAIYRVYNPNAKGGDHYYTMSKYEASQLVSQGWKWDNNGKPVFYSGGTKPVYVAYNPNAQTGAHNYTMNKYEQKSLLKVGWKYGATAWYGLS